MIIPHVLGCQESIWMGNVTKFACKWFQVEKDKSKFTQKFIEDYDDDINDGYIYEVDVSYPKYL